MPDQPGQLGQVVAHEGHVGGFDGNVRAHGAHGHAQMRGGQGGGIVDAVSDHGHFPDGGRQLRNRPGLVLRQKVGPHLRHAGLARNLFGARPGIAGQHDDRPDARFLELVQDGAGLRPDRVLDVQEAQHGAAAPHRDDRPGGFFVTRQQGLFGDRQGMSVGAGEIAHVADMVGHAVDIARRAESRSGLRSLHRAGGDTLCCSMGENGPGHGMAAIEHLLNKLKNENLTLPQREEIGRTVMENLDPEQRNQLEALKNIEAAGSGAWDRLLASVAHKLEELGVPVGMLSAFIQGNGENSPAPQ